MTVSKNYKRFNKTLKNKTDGHQNIILTASGADTTILAGSYIYLNPGADGDELAIKGCIRTTGGTVAITYAA